MSPIMEEIRNKAALKRSEYGGDLEDQTRDIYHVKWIKYNGQSAALLAREY